MYVSKLKMFFHTIVSLQAITVITYLRRKSHSFGHAYYTVIFFWELCGVGVFVRCTCARAKK